jgi:hypothetical protein
MEWELFEVLKMVPTTGLEPVRCYSLEPESSASANSATWATCITTIHRFYSLRYLLCIPYFLFVNEITDTPGLVQVFQKRASHLSKDKKWRSILKVPHLLQYVYNGSYYAWIKINGKIKRDRKRESLKTDVWSTAELRHPGFLKKSQEDG